MTSRGERPEGEALPEEDSLEKQWTIVLVVLAAIVIALAVSIVVFHLESEGPDLSTHPTADLWAHPTPEGYEIRVVVSEVHALDGWEVNVLKDGEPWSGFPVPLEGGILGRGPAGEYLNFTDLASDGNLTQGDFFDLENVESATEYMLELFWQDSGKKVAAVTINVP